MTSIVIIDYGMGNLHSISKALEHVAQDAHVQVSSRPETILSADRVVFPGVGGIRDCMVELRRLGMDEVIHEAARNRPLLGVCLGMQALLEYSEENDGTDCLGIIPGRVCRFSEGLADIRSGRRLKIPHMGWNQVHQEGRHPLWRNVPQDSRFYFVHSYHAESVQEGHVAATTDYGVSFPSVIARENVFAMQFHPEKSQHACLRILENFVYWDGEQ